jgi:hypothetical protein
MELWVASARKLSFDDFSALDAACANTNALVPALKLRLHWAKIDTPAAPGDVVCVRNVIAELRTFATNTADLSHDLLQCFELFAQTYSQGLKRLDQVLNRQYLRWKAE